MGGRRGVAKKNLTPPVTESKKIRNGAYSPPPVHVVTTLQQRAEPKSPDPTDCESLSGESYVSSVNSRPASHLSDTDPPLAGMSASSSTLILGKSNTINNDNTTPTVDPSVQSVSKTPLPPPIIINASLWRQAAPLIIQNQDISSIGFASKSSSDDKIYVKTSSTTQFCQIQKILIVNNIDFHTFFLAADRQLKVVIKGIPTDISAEELKS
ncbi:unnamed protein product [Macrosiphum euphorbiae]|uniref:Uncharacterized protein n=1 Tax=Macrosiphum euphorbiae TaxID=13131 RepID=A0AAV0VQA3_9HEMI|nr:unnamed protein product [Macrosiphum euphorbiae]